MPRMIFSQLFVGSAKCAERVTCERISAKWLLSSALLAQHLAGPWARSS